MAGVGGNLSLTAGTGEISMDSVSGISNLGLSGINLTTSGDIAVDILNMNGMSGDLFIAADSSFTTSDADIDFTVFGNIDEMAGELDALAVSLST